MTTETTQTADGGAPAPAGGSAAGAANLDALLKEFDGGKPETPKPTIPDDVKPVIEWARSEMTNRQIESVQKDVKDAISFVKEDESIKDLPDKMVRGMLEAHASEDPTFKQAFENRSKDPAAWKAKLAEARTAVAKDLQPLGLGSKVSSDVLAARASISGAKPNPGDAPKMNAVDLLHMPQREYDKFIETELARNAR